MICIFPCYLMPTGIIFFDYILPISSRHSVNDCPKVWEESLLFDNGDIFLSQLK